MPPATSHKFTGQERDSESGLDNFNARYDSSTLGRFMSTDPGNAGADLTTPQSWNMYAFVLNNPLIFRDPWGLGCVYLDNQGGTDPSGPNGFYVDNESNPDECGEEHGTWFDGNTDPTSVVADPNSNWVGALDSSGQEQAGCNGDTSSCSAAALSGFIGSATKIVVDGNAPVATPFTDDQMAVLVGIEQRTKAFNSAVTCAASVAYPLIPGVNPFDLTDIALDSGETAASQAADKAADAAAKIKQATRLGPSRLARIAKMEERAEAAEKASKVFKYAGKAAGVYGAGKNFINVCIHGKDE